MFEDRNDARLFFWQDVFTKKVLTQKDDIDLIAATAVGATENIRDGNEELRKAIQNQVRLRLVILERLRELIHAT